MTLALRRPRLLGPHRRATPTVLQMEAAECGAACLAMVLGAFGRHEHLDTLRAACAVSRDGVSAASLLRAAERFGLTGEAYPVEPADLARLPTPQILFWNFNHFVVLERVVRGGRGFVVVDPSCGRRRIGAAEMDRSFTGLTLAFERTRAFRPARRRSGLGAALREVLGGAWGTAASIVASTVLLTLVGILLPSVTRVFVDEYLNAGRHDWLVPILAGVAAIAVLRTLLLWINAQLSLFMQTRITGALSARLVWATLRLPFAFLSSRSPAELSTRTQLAGQVAGTATGPVLQLVNALVMAAGFGLAMLAYSPVLTAAVLAVLAANMLLLALANRALADRAAEAQMMAGKSHAAAIAGIAHLAEARATGTVPLLFRRLVEAYVDETNTQARSAAVTQRVAAVPFFCDHLLAIVVLGLGSYLVMRTEFTIGSLLAFQMLAQMFAGPLKSLVGLGAAVVATSGSVERLRDLFAAAPRDAAPVAAAPAGRLSGAVAVEGAGFAFPGRPALFADLSARFAPGSATLVVGASGSGKTTLAMLLAGVLQPTSGSIRFDGQTADAIAPDTFRRSVGFAEQTPFFPAGSLKDALTLWDGDLDDARVAAALKAAAVDAAVMARPGGLAGRIGEGGGGFSGGELQRLGIARALAAGPTILVVDDATTALDPETERTLFANLRRLPLTLVVLSSRADVGGAFDAVLALRGGRLVPAGAP